VTNALKVPALSLALVFAIAACSGDPESTADMDESAWESEVTESQEALDQTPPPAQVRGGEPAPRVTTPAPPPASGQRTSPPPPVQDDPDAVTPPAQDPPATGDVHQEWEELESPINALPVGTMISARLTDDISTRTHREGDVFLAQVTDDLRGGDGNVLVPAGTQVVGRVATARASSDSNEEAVLVLAFDALMLEGEQLPLRATVLDAQVEGDAGDSGTRTAAKVATGAAAGAILGQILGRDTRSTVAGAAAGAVAGAGIALTTRDGHAVIPEGSTLRLQLDAPLVVSRVR
jgi:hypothetical protein